jgi:hypothetical protein
VAAGAPGGGTTTPPPPSLPTVVTQVSAGTWFAPGSEVNGGPDDYQDMTGVYSNTGGPVGASCSFTVAGASFSGVWINRSTGPGSGDWSIDGDGGEVGYDWACLNVAAPPVSQPGSVSLTCIAFFCDDGDILHADANGFTNGPDDYEFEFEWAPANGTDCSSPGAAGGSTVVQSNDDTVDGTTVQFSGNRCYHARARANNGNGFGPFSAYSNWVFVDDN